MLRNGLGELLATEVPKSTRFVDLFTGSAAVANHVAQNFEIEVLASDLQTYSVVLADAVISRIRRVDAVPFWAEWSSNARKLIRKFGDPPTFFGALTKQDVIRQRSWCENQKLPITSAYGGHYFSAEQALWIDALRATLPSLRAKRCIALAALIRSASQCAAGPGHTAQPFQPTLTAKKHLQDAWRRDVLAQTQRQLNLLSSSTAHVRGRARRIDANLMALNVGQGDLVFIDPPYSGVHYSRFYHVLETVASGATVEVSGIGRYPPESERPRSSFSIQSESHNAFDALLKIISERKASAIITFPAHECSNGLSGHRVIKLAKKHFSVRKKTVASKFSSLGGTSDSRGNEAGRDARVDASELILHLTPR
ncbi:DNA adenine methylase [Afipia carboxidovorans]|uniref:DNA adenine methylase n=1 Tax=Afipia carboxidovorans TaxID=40137 RepID=UPI0030D02988